MPQPDDFYSSGAYRPDTIPEQPPAIKQPWFKRFGSLRLPWGSTQDMMPPSLLTSITPHRLREQEEFDQVRDEQKSRGEYVPRPFEHIDLHVRYDNEKIQLSSAGQPLPLAHLDIRQRRVLCGAGNNLSACVGARYPGTCELHLQS